MDVHRIGVFGCQAGEVKARLASWKPRSRTLSNPKPYRLTVQSATWACTQTCFMKSNTFGLLCRGSSMTPQQLLFPLIPTNEARSFFGRQLTQNMKVKLFISTSTEQQRDGLKAESVSHAFCDLKGYSEEGAGWLLWACCPHDCLHMSFALQVSESIRSEHLTRASLDALTSAVPEPPHTFTLKRFGSRIVPFPEKCAAYLKWRSRTSCGNPGQDRILQPRIMRQYKLFTLNCALQAHKRITT